MGRTSDEHFSVDGSLLRAWASHKSLAARDGSDEPPGEDQGRNPDVDFRGKTRTNKTHVSRTIEVGEVWGVRRKICRRMEEMGIHTVEQLRTADADLIRRRFSAVLERTIRELRGLSCLELEEVTPDKQQIVSSRSFSRLLMEHAELEEAVASYMAIAAEKLRRQGCLAGAVQVYIRTNIFKPDVPQYQQTVKLPLPALTDDTGVLTRRAFRILKRIYRPEYAFHKAGIMLLNLAPIDQYQPSLFTAEGEEGGRPQVRSIKPIAHHYHNYYPSVAQ